jgi:hypothetical protein
MLTWINRARQHTASSGIDDGDDYWAEDRQKHVSDGIGHRVPEHGVDSNQGIALRHPYSGHRPWTRCSS